MPEIGRYIQNRWNVTQYIENLPQIVTFASEYYRKNKMHATYSSDFRWTR